MRTPAWVLIGLLLAAGFAGCLSGDEDAFANETTGTNQADPASNASTPPGSMLAPNQALLSYAGIEDPYQATMWQNGTVSTTDSCIGGGCAFILTSENPPHSFPIEITDIVPPNVPVEVTANLSWSDPESPFGPLHINQFSLYPETEKATAYQWHTEGAETWLRLNATLVRDAAGTANVVMDVNLAEPEGASYTLKVTARADPSTVPMGVPVAVPIQDEDTAPTVALEGSNASGIQGLLWDAQDALTERRADLGPDQLWRVNATDSSGEHVLAFFGNATAAQLHANASGTMRALPVVTELGEAHSVSPQGQATWTTNVENVPYAAGLYVRASAPGQNQVQAETELATPKGVLVEGTDSTLLCTLCSDDAPEGTWLAEPGDPTMVEGEWSGTYEGMAATNTEVGTLFVRYVR